MLDQSTFTSLGDYTILAKLGSGSLGSTYIAEHRILKKRVVIKLLPKEICLELDKKMAILTALNERGMSIIMIEHIMRAVMRFSHRIIVLDAGRTIAEGTPEEIVQNTAVEKAYLGE